MTKSSTSGKKRLHRLRWVLESLMEEPGYLERPMFGCLACYVHGRLSLLLTSGAEPWNGLLIPTDHQFQESLRREYRGVIQHPVLKKWLYLPESFEDFETVALDVAGAIRLNDPRFGVEPKERRPRRKRTAPQL